MKRLSFVAVAALMMSAGSVGAQNYSDADQLPALSGLPTFDSTSHYWYRDSHLGPYQLSGRANLDGSHPYTCAGTSVALLPDTAFFRALIDKEFSDGYGATLTEARDIPLLSQKISDPVQVRRFVRVAPCVDDGNFQFTNLPAGQWIVLSQVNKVNPKRPNRVLATKYVVKHIELGNKFKHGTVLQKGDIIQ